MSNASHQAISGKRGANRERILRAALEIISAQGVDKVTHRAVAGLANVSPGTTTYHFASREALVRDAFDLYIADSEKALVEALTQRPLQSREDFIGFLSGMTTLQPEQSAFSAIEYEMVLFAARDSEMKMRVAAWSRVLDSWLSDPLERLGATRPLEGARILVALCRGSEFEVLSRQMPLSGSQFHSRLNAMLDLVLGLSD
ncbi:MAG: TetR family transcriptional regulator [Pseudomonadota bacterium]